MQLNIKIKMTTTEDLHNFNVNNEETEIEILYTLVQPSIQMETAAKKSKDWEGSNEGIRKKNHQVQECVSGDQD